jgi:hypothetical protein
VADLFEEQADKAPIANAGEIWNYVDDEAEPRESDIGTDLYLMWAGAHAPHYVWVWAGSFDDAFEELVEHLDDEAPGLLTTLDEGDLKRAAEDEDIEWKEEWPDWEDPEFERVVQAAEVDYTTIGHTTLKHGTHIASWEWGGDEVTDDMVWLTVAERSVDETEED